MRVQIIITFLTIIAVRIIIIAQGKKKEPKPLFMRILAEELIDCFENIRLYHLLFISFYTTLNTQKLQVNSFAKRARIILGYLSVNTSYAESSLVSIY